MGTTTPGHSEPGGNGDEGVFQHSPKLQDWSFTIRCSFVSYQGHLEGLTPQQRCSWCIV